MPGRVVVTGATGFIGWSVCERLRDEGWTVVALVRPGSAKPWPEGVQRAEAALDAAAIVRACGRADALVHAAGVVRARSAAEYHAVNVGGTRAALEAARTLDARLIHVSSLTAAGPSAADRPRREADPSQPITDYGRSKLAAEALFGDASSVRWTILRPAAVYGPRDRQFLPLFQAARLGLFLRPPNASAFSLTLAHVDDVARAIQMACASEIAEGETLFIGHATPVSFDVILETMAGVVGRRYRPLPVPFAIARLGSWLGVGGLTAERLQEARSPGFVCSVERAERSLGFRAAIDLEDGLRSTLAWYRANRWLR